MRLVAMKSFLAALFLLCLASVGVYAQPVENMEVYNRGEKVDLSGNLIFCNDDYYISIQDLDKINLEYVFSETEAGFSFQVYSQDYFGKENILKINATKQVFSEWDDTINDFVPCVCYSFSNKMDSKKWQSPIENGFALVDTPMGNSVSVVIRDGEYYISLKTIARAISYEYVISDNVIKLWISDGNHNILNGRISLPDGVVAGVGGEKVRVLIRDKEQALNEKYTMQTFLIPEGENYVDYFVESDVTDSRCWLTFEFDGDYKTVKERYAVGGNGYYCVTATATTKKDFKVCFSLPGGRKAQDDIYADVEFEGASIYTSDEPVIKKGDSIGTVTVRVDEAFSGKVTLLSVTGDNGIFPYGYYGLGELRFTPENARIVPSSANLIEIELMVCYEVSGKVLPLDMNSGYKIEVFGVTDYNEKLYLYDEAEDDFSFSVTVPSALYEYTLSVCYKSGVYCRYVSDGVSTYGDEYHLFENICDYTKVELKYEPYLPEYPVTMFISASIGRAVLRNISDVSVSDFDVYCAYYRKGRPLSVEKMHIDEIAGYRDSVQCSFQLPDEFYKADEGRVFVWKNGKKPLCLAISEKVNKHSGNEGAMFYFDVQQGYRYYPAIEDMYHAGIMNGYSDGTFCPEAPVMRSEASRLFCQVMEFWGNKYNFSCDDVPSSNWESSYVGICVNEKVFELEDNKFRPAENITVRETYDAVCNILKGKNIQADADKILTNIDQEDLERDITRGEIAQMLYNYRNCL